MAEWKLSYTGECLIVSSGLIYLNDRKPKGLRLADVLELIKAHPRIGYYETKIKRRVTLGDALNAKKFGELGTIKEMSTSVDLYKLDLGRNFSKLPISGEQLLKNHYQSKPITIQE